MSKKSIAFGRILRKFKDDPVKFRRILKAGMGFENLRRKKFPNKNRPSFVNTINYLAVSEVFRALKGNDVAWVNLLAPSEILLAAGLSPVSAEGISGTMSSMHLEDIPLNLAAANGVSNNLCTFHRASIGTAMWRVFPRPEIVVTTTILCDGNPGSFYKISKSYGSPFFLIDVPRGRRREYVPYVEKQLYELIELIESITGNKFSYEKLSEYLEREKQTVENLNYARRLLASKAVPMYLYEQMNTLYIMHTLAGSEELLKASKELIADLEDSSVTPSKRILWLHIPPYYDNELFELFSPDGKVWVITDELWWDWLYPVKPEDPVRSLAEKLVFNIGAGTVQERAEFLLKLASDLRVSGAIHFSHWGCRQSSGGVGYLKDAFSMAEIPFLELSGDCVDHNSESAGQLKTRVNAFLEILGVRE
ncbi:2-hydroxyacyl-CoA dehydratase subunit D [Kosmotoga pacifica]|uniref:2-hydroxyglutaryl-CoA dehydratase n=1 Tax=Kosmotoga pacifica TaxID=1330330 RepID=A0A0G2ZD09_9BACT|nr:2-hydroxyacyl-CoA dehydratase family protein [Kosmotoga pacifica]AKI97966.1 2-hydroxyglutaryl-CoA dehydratase [Kosmotoga pacifica]